MNSLVFIENREAIFSLQPTIIIEEISLKSTKRISLNELQKIKSFLSINLARF
jgi:membrane-anchored glycerophosphoryl diester phosphodiesterase (GDPDase)